MREWSILFCLTMNQPIQTAPDDTSAVSQALAEPDSIAVEPIEQVISRYFETLNAAEFQATANLFAADGSLYPPFESAVTGREAIVTYLETEARGLQLSPQKHTIDRLEDDTVQCRVTGKVQTPLFGVNVGWTFVCNSACEILSVQVKLLAALEELLKLKPQSSEP